MMDTGRTCSSFYWSPMRTIFEIQKILQIFMLIWSSSSTFVLSAFVKCKRHVRKRCPNGHMEKLLNLIFTSVSHIPFFGKGSLGLLKHVCKSTWTTRTHNFRHQSVSLEHEHSQLLVDPTGKAFPESSKRCRRIVAIFLSPCFTLDWWHHSKNTKFRFQVFLDSIVLSIPP